MSMKYEAVSIFHMRRRFAGVKGTLSFLTAAGFGRGGRGGDEGLARTLGGKWSRGHVRQKIAEPRNTRNDACPQNFHA